MSDSETKQEKIERMEALRKERDEAIEAMVPLQNIPEHPPAIVSLLSLGLIGGGIYFAVKVQQPRLFEPTILLATAMVLVGAGVFYYFKYKTDRELNRRKRLKERIDSANVTMKELARETGVPFPKMKKKA